MTSEPKVKGFQKMGILRNLKTDVFIRSFTILLIFTARCASLVTLINKYVSCKDLKQNGKYVYNFGKNWTKSELHSVDWTTDHVILAYFQLNDSLEKNSDIVTYISPGLLVTKQCLNVTYTALDTNLKEMLVNFIVSDSPENDASPTSWLTYASIATAVLLIITVLVVWNMGCFRKRCWKRQGNQELKQIHDRDAENV